METPRVSNSLTGSFSLPDSQAGRDVSLYRPPQGPSAGKLISSLHFPHLPHCLTYSKSCTSLHMGAELWRSVFRRVEATFNPASTCPSAGHLELIIMVVQGPVPKGGHPEALSPL